MSVVRADTLRSAAPRGGTGCRERRNGAPGHAETTSWTDTGSIQLGRGYFGATRWVGRDGECGDLGSGRGPVPVSPGPGARGGVWTRVCGRRVLRLCRG